MATFVHTIGGYYTKDDGQKFIKEAREAGVNRRIASHLLAKVTYGDVVMVLLWNHGKPVAIGQFIVERVSFQQAIMDKLAKAIIKDGEGELVGGGGGGTLVERECGSYIDAGGVKLFAASPLTVQDIVARGKAIAADMGIKKLETFVGGRFAAFSTPLPLPKDPAKMGVYKRGFWEVDWRPVRKRGAGDREATGIGAYHLRTHVERDDPLLKGRAK